MQRLENTWRLGRNAISKAWILLILVGAACSPTPATIAPEVVPPTVRPSDTPAPAFTNPPPTPEPPAALPTINPTAAIQPQAPVIPPWPVVQSGSEGADVFALQYLLRYHGQNIPADGLFGPVTRQAVMNFQTQKGLVVDGMVGAQTWPALVEGLVIQNGSSGDAVRAAQHLLLVKFGYLDVVVDGLFGPVTEAAVKSYQTNHGLVVDGMVGAVETWPSLISNTP